MVRGADHNSELDSGIADFLAQLTSGPPLPLSETPEDLARLRQEALRLRQPLNLGGPDMGISRRLVLKSQERALNLHLHVPKNRRSSGLLLYFHGGGWTLLNGTVFDRVMRETAAAAGVAVLGLDYALAPENPFPDALHDCLALFAILRNGAFGDEAGVEYDPERLAVAGDSAGANLALSTALALRDHGQTLPKALWLCYGAFDPEQASDSQRFYADGRYLLSAHRLGWFWRNYLSRTSDRRDPLAAPLLAELAGLPPCYLSIAEHDLLRDENLALAERLFEAGVEVHTDLVKGTIHAFIEACGMAEVSLHALQRAARFLDEKLL